MIERLQQILSEEDASTTVRRVKNLATLWRRARPAVGTTPADVVHRENKWTLLHYRRTEPARYRRPILLVPSLINRHYVLDLAPGRSFVEYLLAQGHDVYSINWGKPGPEDRYLSFDTFADRYIGRAVRVASRDSGSVHVLGYCLGGTLATIHAALRPERVASLLALAAPIRFRVGGLLDRWVGTPALDPATLAEGFGNIPWPLMQASFQFLRPTSHATKAIALVERAWDDEFLDGFFALERWGNDNVSFPGRAWREYVENLYRRDALLDDSLVISGRRVRLSAIRCPTLVISFEHDHIVPADSASVLAGRVGARDVTHWHLPGGHVGAVVSRRGSQRLWPQMSQWWAERDGTKKGAPSKRRPRRKTASQSALE